MTLSFNSIFNYASAYSSSGGSSAYASSGSGFSQAYASSGQGYSQAYASSGFGCSQATSGGYKPITPGSIHRINENSSGFYGKSTSSQDELSMMSGFNNSSDGNGDMMKKVAIGSALALNPMMGLADLISGGKLHKEMMENGPDKMGKKVKDKMKSDMKKVGKEMKDDLKHIGKEVLKIFSKL